jgi:FolB domain-containing protein
MDKIIIKDLEIQTHIGVTEAERAQPQRLLLTVELERDLAAAGRSDAEAATTPYDVVVDMVRQVVAGRPRKLIEAVADEVADVLLAHKMALSVTVEVKKFSIPGSQYVAVQITRSQ